MNKDWNYTYSIIKNYCNKRLSRRAGIICLNVCPRQFYRYVKKYRKYGKDAFKEKNLNIIPPNKISKNIETKIIELWDKKYSLWSIHHFNVELNNCYDIHISDVSLRRILWRNLRVSKFATKETKRKIKRLILEKNNKHLTPQVIQQIEEEIPILPKSEQHCRLAQPKYYGEEVQMDASQIKWFSNDKTTLHVAIDRKQGLFLSGWFDKQETLEAYYYLSKDLFIRYGKPTKIVTDNRECLRILESQ